MPWRPEFFVGLQPNDPRNADRHDPLGGRIRFRFNRSGGSLVDFVVQYETPVGDPVRSHRVVLRSDMTHAPHIDRFDRFGRHRQQWLDPSMTPSETIAWVTNFIRVNWERLRADFYEGLR